MPLAIGVFCDEGFGASHFNFIFSLFKLSDKLSENGEFFQDINKQKKHNIFSEYKNLLSAIIFIEEKDGDIEIKPYCNLNALYPLTPETFGEKKDYYTELYK